MAAANTGMVNLRRSKLLNAQLGQPLALVNGLLKSLAGNKTSSETGSERITSTSSVVDSALLNGVDGELLDLASASNNRRQSTLSDDSNTLALGVRFGESGEGEGNLLDISRSQTVALSIRQRFSLVTNNVIPVRRSSIQRVLEELRDEWCGQREDEGLVLGRSLLGQHLDRRRAHGQMVPTNEVELRALDQLPHLRAL